MKLTNYYDHETKLDLALGASAALAGIGIYYSPLKALKWCIPGIAITSLLIYNGRNLIDLIFDAASEKCPNGHLLNNSVKEVISLNEKFKGLENIDVFIYNSNIPNAFACGLTKGQAAIYFSAGILEKFDNDYTNKHLQAVTAHELGHISGSHVFLNSIKFNADKIVKILGEYIPFFGPLVKKFYKLSTSFVSRQLEYDADQTAAECGFGLEIIEALDKISGELKLHKDSKAHGIFSYLSETFSTHPSVINRADAINAYLYEQETEYDNWYDHFVDSCSHTLSRIVDENTNPFYKYSGMIGIMDNLHKYEYHTAS